MLMERGRSPREKYVKRLLVVPPGVQPMSTMAIPCSSLTSRILATAYAARGMSPNWLMKPMRGAFGLALIFDASESFTVAPRPSIRQKTISTIRIWSTSIWSGGRGWGGG
jgi:hypothetical protein